MLKVQGPLRLIPLLLTCLPVASFGQEPLDLFADEPALADGFLRIASWNLRHINVEGGAEHFLAGTSREQDFVILTGTYAKAIRDLGLDILVVVEHQPRTGERNRLQQILEHLNTAVGQPWRSLETAIVYDDPSNPFSNLQFGLLWNSSRVTVGANPLLLEDLRQPRDASGNLENQRLRAPWLVSITAGQLSVDILALHLKSGGEAPQAEEVTAVTNFVRQHQGGTQPRHLIVLGDWNIRPDTAQGRGRLQQMAVSGANGSLMDVLTVGAIPPALPDWETLTTAGLGRPLDQLLPFSHFNAATRDTFLDHVAISRTLMETFDHPIQVKLASGTSDLRPGIRLATSMIPEANYNLLTDHLPAVVTLRTATASAPAVPGTLVIEGALPNHTATTPSRRRSTCGTRALKLCRSPAGGSATRRVRHSGNWPPTTVRFPLAKSRRSCVAAGPWRSTTRGTASCWSTRRVRRLTRRATARCPAGTSCISTIVLGVAFRAGRPHSAFPVRGWDARR